MVAKLRRKDKGEGWGGGGGQSLRKGDARGYGQLPVPTTPTDRLSDLLSEGRGCNAGACKFRKRWRSFCTQQEAERGWGGVRTSDKIIRKQIFAN
jgi:hypothetical protein